MKTKHKSKTIKTAKKPQLSRRTLLAGSAVTGIAALGAAGIAWSLWPAPANAAEVVVYKSRYCGCCGKWVDHLKSHGHKVKVHNTEEMDRVKQIAGVPDHLQSCHTAMVDGYVIEGHVPAKEIGKLLSQRPKMAGLSVPGMPAGSPGMEGEEPERYDVILFDTGGKQTVFAKY